jgi:hypothetical protein
MRTTKQLSPKRPSPFRCPSGGFLDRLVAAVAGSDKVRHTAQCCRSSEKGDHPLFAV